MARSNGSYVIPQRRFVPKFRSSSQRDSRTRTISLISPRHVVPERLLVCLPYQEFVGLGSAFFVDYRFNLNSIFDPNQTGTGHQPLGYDQWALFYNRYRVISTRVTARFLNVSTTEAAEVGIIASNSLTALGSIDAFEQADSLTTAVSVRGGLDMKTLQRVYSLAKVNGKTDSQYLSSDDTGSPFGNSPNESIALHVCASTYTGNNVSVECQLRIEYYVELSDPKDLSVS